MNLQDILDELHTQPTNSLYVRTDDVRKKMSVSRLGKVKHTPETKEKIKLQQETNNSNAQRIMTPYGEFASVKQASVELGVSTVAIFRYLNKYPSEYYRINKEEK